ncbi:MAG: transaldolase [Pseudomonadota bacterium]
MNKLDQLKTMTDVVADSGDIDSIVDYKPLDATTNPSLLLKAAQLPRYDSVINDVSRWVLEQNVEDGERIALAADRLAVAIGNEILDIIPGRISTEVDARLSFNTAASIARARRLVEFYDELGRGRDRLLIKLASTWEGIEAARVLERDGIQCNLTLLFSDVQAVAAAEAGAFLISPFVGRILDWHKANEPDRVFTAEDDPGVVSVRNIYRLFKHRGYETIVMGASFRNVGEIEALAGCDRLTISPALLDELANADGELPRRLAPNDAPPAVQTAFKDEADFRFQLNADQMATEKLSDGIRGFVRDQIKLEGLLADRLDAVKAA